MIKITGGKLLVGRTAKTQGEPDKNGFIKAFLINEDGTIQNEFIYVNIKNIESI